MILRLEWYKKQNVFDAIDWYGIITYNYSSGCLLKP